MLASGVVVAQFVTIIASPILTRLYSPNAFGVFAVFSAVLVVCSAVSELNYRLVIPIAEDDRKASHALFVALSVLVSFTVIITVIVWLFRVDIATLLKVAELEYYLWFLPLAVLIDAVFILGQLWSIRAKAFKRVSWAQASQGIVAVTAQTTMGFFNFGAFGLVLGKIIGAVVGLIALQSAVVKEIKPHALNISLKYTLLLSKEYYRFPLYKAPASLISVLNRQIAFFLFPVFFGPAETGLYALTYRVLQTPGIFLGIQIQRVFLSTAAESKRTGKLTASSRLMYRALLQIGLPTFALFGLIAPDVFLLVFGENWRQAGVYAQFLMPYIFLAFLGAPFSVLPMVYDKQKVDLAFQGVLFVCQVMAIVTAGLLYDATMAIVLISLIGSGAWVCYLTWTMSLAGHSRGVVLGDFVREMLYAIPFLTPVIIAKGVLIEPLSRNFTFAIALASMSLLAVVLGFRLKRMFAA